MTQTNSAEYKDFLVDPPQTSEVLATHYILHCYSVNFIHFLEQHSQTPPADNAA